MNPETNDLREEFLEVYKENAPTGVGAGALKFVPRYSGGFLAEVAVSGDDLIFHFHKPPPSRPQTPQDLAAMNVYWGESFPSVLDEVARGYFRAEHPRLVAMRVEDQERRTEFDGQEILLDSWWLKAKGFILDTSDPEALVDGFYRALEEGLRKRNCT